MLRILPILGRFLPEINSRNVSLASLSYFFLWPLSNWPPPAPPSPLKKTTHTEWKRKSFLQIVFTNPIDSLFINTHKNNFTFILSYKSSPKAMSKNRVPSWSNLIRLFLSLPRSVPMTTLVIATPRSAGLLAQFPGMGPPSLAGLMLPGHPGLMGMPRFR